MAKPELRSMVSNLGARGEPETVKKYQPPPSTSTASQYATASLTPGKTSRPPSSVLSANTMPASSTGTSVGILRVHTDSFNSIDGHSLREFRRVAQLPQKGTPSAHRGVAPIDRNRGPGDEIGGRAREEDGDALHVRRHAPAPARRAREHAFVEPLDLGTRPFRELRVDPPRQDRVHLDVVGRPRDRHRLRELHDAALARAVCGRVRGTED